MEEYLKHMAMAYILTKSAKAEEFPYASLDFTNGVHIKEPRICAEALKKTVTVTKHNEDYERVSFRYMGVEFYGLELLCLKEK